MEHPEVIEEAMQVLRERQELAQRKRAAAAIAENGERCGRTRCRRSPAMREAMSPSSSSSITNAAIASDRCSPVMDLLAADGQVRVVWKEFPILGPASRFATRAAMAADRQGRYHEFHVAVMGARGKLTKDGVIRIGANIGLDVERLRRDMGDPAIEDYLNETAQLAKKLGIRGTPAFVIGETLVPGAVNGTRLKEIVADARSGG